MLTMAIQPRSNRKVRVYDQDRWGWVMVGAVFLSAVIIFGNLKALGVIILVIKDDFETDLWIVGWIAVMHVSTRCLMTPFTAAISRMVGSRPVVITGGVLTALGFALCSTASSVLEWVVYIVVIAGSGSAGTFMILLGNMALYFDKNYPLACAISLCGVPVGYMMYGPLTQLLLDTYGWKGTCLVLGGLSSHLIVCGALIRPVTTKPCNYRDYQSISTQGEPSIIELSPKEGPDCFESGNGAETLQMNELGSEHDGNPSPNPGRAGRREAQDIENTNRCSLCGELLASLDVSVFCETRFNLLNASSFFLHCAYTGWLVFLVAFGQLAGLTSWQSSLLPVAVGVGNVVGKLAICVVFLKTAITGHCIFVFGGTVASVTFFVVPFAPSFPGQLTTSFVLSVAMAFCTQGSDVLFRYVLTDDDRLFSVYGWATLSKGVGAFIGGFFAGWLHEVTGSIMATNAMFSAVTIVSGAFILVDYVLVRRTAVEKN